MDGAETSAENTVPVDHVEQWRTEPEIGADRQAQLAARLRRSQCPVPNNPL